MFRDSIKILPMFVQKAIYEHDISHLKLSINSTQTLILMFVNENSGKTMSEISSLTGLEKSSFTRSVDYLVKNDLVTKNFPPHDRRTIHLSLTKRGSRAADLIKNDFDRYLESLIAHFSENEKKEFIDTLRTLSGYMQKIVEYKNR